LEGLQAAGTQEVRKQYTWRWGTEAAESVGVVREAQAARTKGIREYEQVLGVDGR